MKFWILPHSILFLVAFFFIPNTQAREVIDALLTRVTLTDHPKRIVTLLPSLGELVASIAPQNISRIVGVSEYTDFPESLRKVAQIGSFQRINLELIASLRPELVLASSDGNNADQIRHLRELSIPVFVVATDSIAHVKESMRLVGLAMGEEALGVTMAQALDQGLERFRKRARVRQNKTNPRKILIVVGSKPLIVAGKKSFLNDALEVLGAINLYSDLAQTYPRPSLEDAISRNPDDIVLLGMSLAEKTIQQMEEEWSGFSQVKAIRDHKIHIFRDDTIARPTFRLLQGLEQLEKALFETK